VTTNFGGRFSALDARPSLHDSYVHGFNILREAGPPTFSRTERVSVGAGIVAERIPNKQFNLTSPGSLSVRVGTYQRRRMYTKFLNETNAAAGGTILDVGVAADVTYESSNYLEQWYPDMSAITAVRLDDAAFLKQLYGVRFVKASGLHLPFGDGAFNVVHSSAVLEHRQAKYARRARNLAVLHSRSRRYRSVAGPAIFC
jgi:hypothetical protein